MRFTWIDGIYKEIAYCGECPYYATEMELAGYCRYPVNPANNGQGFKWIDSIDEIRPDCPLRIKE